MKKKKLKQTTPVHT